VADNLEEESENIAVISNLCQGKELSCDTKNFVRSDDHLATHYGFESATALLAIRNTQNEDAEDEDEEEKEGEGEEAAEEQDISTKIRIHEQVLHCISECSLQLIQTLPAFLNYCIQLRTAFKKT
jgi:hypothetical protein